MKRIITIAISIIALLALAACSGGFLDGSAASSDEAAGKIPLVIDPSSSAAPYHEARSEDELQRLSNYGYLILKTSGDFDAGLVERLGAETVAAFDLEGTRYSLIRRDREVLALMNELARAKGVLYAEPDWRLELDSSVDYSTDLDDPWISKGQYAYWLTGLGEALVQYGVGTNEVYVAVVDSGINATHEEFGGVWDHGYSMWSKSGVAGSASYAYVGSGIDPEPMDPTNWDSNAGEGHGTHVAGTIAALGNNALGVVGVAPDNVRLITYKCFANDQFGGDETGSGSSWAVYGSLKHLVDWKANPANGVTQATLPVNMSLGGSKANYFAIDMIDYGLEYGVVVIAASGNEGQELAKFPAAYQGVITVGATDGRDELAPFSNRGRHVSVTAPGVDIVSTGNWANSAYQPMSGTSMATPFVTGLVALLLTHDATLSPAEVKQLLESNAEDLGAAGFDRSFGYGRIDALATLTDLLDGGTIDTPYSEYTLSATLNNLAPSYDNGLATDAIIGQPVYLYDSAGAFIGLSMSDETGQAAFNLLRAGNYALAVDYYGHSLQGGGAPRKTVTFSGDADMDAAFDFSAPIYHFQTLENDGNGYFGASGASYADTVLSLFDSSGRLLLRYDSAALDSIEWACESGETYYLAVEPWFDEDNGITWSGNYSLMVSETPVEDDVGNAGASLSGSPARDVLEANDTSPTATLISLNTPYRCFLSDGDTYADADLLTPAATGVDLIDWFRFVTP